MNEEVWIEVGEWVMPLKSSAKIQEFSELSNLRNGIALKKFA